jgi:cysteinyl-tRNA synthetase
MPCNRIHLRSVLALLPFTLVWALNAGCPQPGGSTDPNTPTPADTTISGQVTLKDVRFWAYQIQGLEERGAVDALVASRYDLLVLEPTRTERESAAFDTHGMVARLQASPASRDGTTKLVIAYIDIGEAEDWRFYWQAEWVAPAGGEPGSPDFLIRVDPGGWAGDYPVAFWDPRWKDIIIYNHDSLLQQALDDGFDGIYMDWVEAYSDEMVAAAAESADVDPVQAMVDFIREIRDYARQQNPDFLVIPQNAAELAGLNASYLDLIDAIGHEQVYFGCDADSAWGDANSGDLGTPATGEGHSTQYYEEALEPYLTAGKVVLSIDYAQQPANVAEAYERAAANGYVPYVTLCALSQLTETPPPGYPGAAAPEGE